MGIQPPKGDTPNTRCSSFGSDQPKAVNPSRWWGRSRPGCIPRYRLLTDRELHPLFSKLFGDSGDPLYNLGVSKKVRHPGIPPFMVTKNGEHADQVSNFGVPYFQTNPVEQFQNPWRWWVEWRFKLQIFQPLDTILGYKSRHCGWLMNSGLYYPLPAIAYNMLYCWYQSRNRETRSTSIIISGHHKKLRVYRNNGPLPLPEDSKPPMAWPGAVLRVDSAVPSWFVCGCLS